MQSESERKELHEAQNVISAIRNRRESLHDRLSRKNSFDEASSGKWSRTAQVVKSINYPL
jgi:hypothetical protein